MLKKIKLSVFNRTPFSLNKKANTLRHALNAPSEVLLSQQLPFLPNSLLHGLNCMDLVTTGTDPYFDNTPEILNGILLKRAWIMGGRLSGTIKVQE